MAPKVRPWEARFGSELDWEKLWRDQVSGAKMTETHGNKLFFQGFRGGVWHPKCDHGRLVLDVRGQDDRDKGKQTFFSRDSEAAFGTQSATMGGWFWTRIRLGKAVADQVSGAKMTETNRNKLLFF